MEVKAGYKLTEVGVIPEDWEIQTIGTTMRLINGRAFKPSEWKDRGLPIIRIQNLNDANATFNYCADPVEDKHIIEAGDLLFAWSGTTGTSFGARVWQGPTGVLNQHIFKVIPDQKKLTLTYTLLVLRKVQAEIEKEAHGFKASFVHVKKADLVGIQLPIPSTIEEQEAIATVLSNIDELLVTLDSLIVKKHLVKQGVMQELLAGKSRLSGFSSEWKTKKIGDLLGYEQPGKYIVKNTEYNENSEMPVLTAGKTFLLGYTNEDEGIYRNFPVIIFDDFTTASKYVEFPFKVKSSAIKLLKTKNENADLRFMFEKMQTVDFIFSDHKRYFISEYQNIEIKVPALPEQTAIAEILSEMDDEIAALEARREKTRLLKEGMMQELLTGRIRLI